MMSGMNPLERLPPELVLRIVDHIPVPSLASATRACKGWHQFIDGVHVDAIYEKKISKPIGSKDFSFLNRTTSFAKYYESVQSWKDLCKRQVLLQRNWQAAQPMTTESVAQVLNDPVWRFRPDFKRRFIVSTSQAGGLHVTDMDDGRLLWSLPSTLRTVAEAVRPYAHLEYDDGMAVFDREGDALEVWQADEEPDKRGAFHRIAILPHDCQTKGFQLSHGMLCVASSQGKGFVYDASTADIRQIRQIDIEHGAVGHLYQDADVVLFSMGSAGYHFFDKRSGQLLGALDPRHCAPGNRHHIKHPSRASSPTPTVRHGPTARLFPAQTPRKDRLVPLHVEAGQLPTSMRPEDPSPEDEWGAGMLDGNLFVGYSRAGRVFVCCDWRRALTSKEALDANSTIIECQSDGSSFDLGGWLSVKDHRIMFEIQDRIYVVALDDDDRLRDIGHAKRPSFSLFTSSAPQLVVPISFMCLYDDCIMTTYTVSLRPGV